MKKVKLFISDLRFTILRAKKALGRVTDSDPYLAHKSDPLAYIAGKS